MTRQKIYFKSGSCIVLLNKNLKLLISVQGQRKKFSDHRTKTVSLFYRGERAKSGGGADLSLCLPTFFPFIVTLSCSRVYDVSTDVT